MAALTPAQIELASSLTQDELPSKLKCANCNKLAVNAFRLPCCETAICESCQSTLPSSCPVCEHSPLSRDDCTVYKSLRTTIRVFLKTEEKKREAARPKANNSAPPTPVQATPTSTPTVAKPDDLPQTQDITLVLDAAAPMKDVANDSGLTGGSSLEAEAPDLVEHDPSHQVVSATNEIGDQNTNSDEPRIPAPARDNDEERLDMRDENVEDQNDDQQAREGDYGQDFGMDGDYNMSFDGNNMNPMQMQMMMMQNGMNPAAFGGFPMMGMGMGMDPMAMQNMMMNGGFGAQGMNMNMGMNGFNGGNNDWNDQQSWQDNFNPNATGMVSSDFGNFNSGFQGGYNAGNFGQYNGRGGYQYRGRGRGRGWRGGFGRGGYNQGYQRGYGQQMWAQEAAQHPANQNVSQSDPNAAIEAQKLADTDEFGRTIRADGEQDTNEDGGKHDAGNVLIESTGQVPTDNASGDAHVDSAMTNGDVSSADPYSRSHGFSYGMSAPAASNAPLNAPTGPKAMRQGLPNTSTLHLRARGFIQDSKPAVTNSPVVESPIQEEITRSRSSSRHSRRSRDELERQPDRDRDDCTYDKENKRNGGGDRDYDRPKSFSRSRSRSRDRKESRRQRRHRSESVTDDGRDDDSHRHKHRSRRSTKDDSDYKSRTKSDKYDERSRSASSDRDRDHRHSSHRSRRDRDRERGKDRDSDRDHRKKSSHRSRHEHDHDRERERDRDRDREKDREKDRERDRKERRKDRDRDRDYRHRSSRRTSPELSTPTEPLLKEFNPPTGPRGGSSSTMTKGADSKPGFSIKGASSKSKSSSSHKHDSELSGSRRGSHVSTSNAPKGAPTGPAKDPHTLEREARDRERLLKEAQRMAGLAGLASLKRGREVGDDRSGRRKNRRSETSYGENEEQRMRRLEAEREGDRWD